MRPVLFSLVVVLTGCSQDIGKTTYTLGYETTLDKAVRNSEINRLDANLIIGYVQTQGEQSAELREHNYGSLLAKAKRWSEDLEAQQLGLEKSFEKRCLEPLASFQAEVEHCLGQTTGKDLVLKPVLKAIMPDTRHLLHQAQAAQVLEKTAAQKALKEGIAACAKGLAERKAWYDKQMRNLYHNKCDEAVGGFGAAAHAQ